MRAAFERATPPGARRASTYRKVHSEKVPSPPASP